MKNYLKPEVEFVELEIAETLMSGDTDLSGDWGVEEWD